MNSEFDVRIEFDEDRLLGAAKYANKKALRSAGAYVRRIAVNSIHRSKKSSPPGTPPNTRQGLLKRSILFGVERDARSVVIGPAKSLVGLSMTAHEFGGTYRGRKYPKRRLIGPALDRAAPGLPKLWRDSIR